MSDERDWTDSVATKAAARLFTNGANQHAVETRLLPCPHCGSEARLRIETLKPILREKMSGREVES